jgi:hypothetical protein
MTFDQHLDARYINKQNMNLKMRELNYEKIYPNNAFEMTPFEVTLYHLK